MHGITRRVAHGLCWAFVSGVVGTGAATAVCFKRSGLLSETLLPGDEIVVGLEAADFFESFKLWS